jgi:hypothetical protein
MEKLDRVLMTREWESMFPMVHIHKNPRIMSDHNPLIMFTQYNQHNKMREFRLELAWLKERKCLEWVQQIWSSPTRDERVLDRVLFKLKKVKKFLKWWGYNRSRSANLRRKKVESALFELEQMEEEGPLNESQIRNRFLLRTEFLKMLEDDEIYWSQRCHKTWLLQWDNNTEFFHRISNGRKRKQTIYSLEDGGNHIFQYREYLKACI